MAARATWKGLLQISLVTIPIKVFPATESSEHLSFHQLHSECQSRMQQKRWCPSCHREVPSAEIVKGFEFEKGRYVVLLEAEVDAVSPPSTRVIDLTQFAPASTLDPIYIDRSYMLAPDGPTALEAFVVMREAMKDTVGIGKMAIYGRECLVAVRPRQHALLLHTLHHAAEIRPLEAIATDDAGAVVFGVSQLRAARQVIAALTQPLHLSDFTDEYQTDLRRLIDAKIAGDEILIPLVPTAAIVNLTEALEQSLAAVRATKATAPKHKARMAKAGLRSTRRVLPGEV